MSSLNMPTTPKTPGSVKGSHKGRWYQSMNMDINKSLVTPGSSMSSYYPRSPQRSARVTHLGLSVRGLSQNYGSN